MQDKDLDDLRAAIAALESQRATLGDTVIELATAPLRQRLASLQRPEGLQRRLVTVLFADIVGSTQLANDLDAEDTLHILNAALRRMATLIEAHQGRVLRFMGDGVKAAFGMDEAREDDAERAVRAGLAILLPDRGQPHALGQAPGTANIPMRVGVHTGDVAFGAGVEADNTAMGAAVNIAARMEQSAPPGALRISHDTWNHVRGLFDVQAQPLLEVKGVDAPMQTYLVRAALNRHATAVERGLHGLATPMVGRQCELQRLLQAVTRTRDSRQLQAVTLIGDAGLGKSRLLREWLAALHRDPAGCRVLSVRCQPDGMLRPWGLLRSLLAVQFGVADTDSAEVARRKVEDGLRPWFDEGGPKTGERQAQLIGQLSGLDFGNSPHLRGLEPRSLRDQALAAFRAYLQALASRGGALPLLVVEDLHWADDSSLDLLQHLLAHAAELPIVLVMTARPALMARLHGWGTPDTPTETTLQLTPLPAAHADTLVQLLLQRLANVPATLTDLIVGQAEGNPYYMEELVRRLIDDGVIVVGEPHWTVHTGRLDTVRLPGTLVGLLQARLDALPAGERRAARHASIIGHVFWDDALQALDPSAPQALSALRSAAFVHASQTSDFEGTAEHHFDHHLLHQVTYDTLIKHERRVGHGAVARWLTERTRGRAAEFLAMTGEHAERAGDTALAIDCFEQAGNEAQKRFANVAATSWLRRALALLGESEPMRRFDLLKTLVMLADIVGDRPRQHAVHQEMDALLERHPDDARAAETMFGKALLADRSGDSVNAERLSRQAFALAERCGAAQWAAMAQANLAWLHIARLDHVAARLHIDSGLQWAAKIEAEPVRLETEAQVLTLTAFIAINLGHCREARDTLQAVLARGEALDKPRMQLNALSNLADVAIQLGEWDAATAWAGRTCALADAIGSRRDLAIGHLRLAESAEGRGDLPTAIRDYDKTHEIHRAIEDRRMQAISLRMLAAAHLKQGDVERALQCGALSQTFHLALNEPLEACEVAAITALCHVHLRRPDAALASLNDVLLRLQRDLAEVAVSETISLRWTCQRVCVALADARAAPLLAQLHAEVQARATTLTDADDRDRLIQAVPAFRDIVAAHARQEQATAR